MKLDNHIKQFSLVWALVLIVTLAAGLGLIHSGENVQAAPPAIPTPASITYSAENTSGPIKFWADGTVLTQTGNSSEFILGQAEALDIHFVIDQNPTLVNTATLTLQFSNDGTNWVNGVAVVTDNAADANDLLQFNNFGHRTRLRLTLTNSNPVTFTHASALARR